VPFNEENHFVIKNVST